MKILGFTYYRNKPELLQKGDSALLVNRKPFFIPDCTSQPVAYPALALRVSKLGKNIGERFAPRYFDAYALALDLQAGDLLTNAQQNGSAWTIATSLDGSFPVGEFIPVEEATGCRFTINGQTVLSVDSLPNASQAICEISRYITIKQGDIIYLPLTTEPLPMHAEDTVRGFFNGREEETLFCRIK